MATASPASTPPQAPPSTPDEARPSRTSRPSLTRLKPVGRWRRRLGWLLALAPVACVVAADFATRGHRILALPPKYVASYTAAVLESAALWAALMWAGAARRGVSRWLAASVFVLLFTCSVGGQLYFHSQYSTYLNLDATLFGTSFTGSVFGQLNADSSNFIKNVGPAFVVSILLVVLGRRLLRPGRRSLWVARFVAPITVIAVFLVPCSYRRVQASTPDVIYFHAIGGLIKELTGVHSTAQIRPGRRTPPAMPQLTPKQPVQRNVILLLTESVRSDCHCSVPTNDCPVAPRANAAVPNRMPLTQLRSNSSTTAIQLAVLWSGLSPNEPRERLHSVPLLFDYATAAGMEVAYWTSHHMMFANSRLWVQDLPTKFQCGASDIEPTADLDVGGDDGLLVDRALEELPKLKEPFFAVVHVGNTHVPYKVDPDDMPFQPAFPSKDPADTEPYRNYYKDAVYLQDKSIGRFLESMRATDYGSRTVVVFTSDHGESFHEHDQVGHTGSLYDEEIHVPGWVDAPPGVLTPDEVANLAAHRDTPAFHTDVTPTILDLLGLWDDPALTPFKQGLFGSSWIRKPTSPVALTLTNCSGVWGCAFRNWGAMRGTLKLHAREWDTDWRCFDLTKDPLEKNDLGPDACGDLREFAERTNDGFPGSR
ncbi:MAG: sulfatase-like hydrolase/transferase [Polyangiaceae bacterium]